MARIYHTWHGYAVSGAPPGIIDTYPGASLAYSFRNLNSAYTGPVCQGQRFSDNAKQDFTAAEMTDGTLAAFSGGGDVGLGIWYDQSGNGADIITTTSLSSQPSIVVSGVVSTINGQPSAFYSGSGRWLKTSAAFAYWATGADPRMDVIVGHADVTSERAALAYGELRVGGIVEIALENTNVRIRVNGGNYLTTGNDVFAPALGKLNLVQYVVPSGASVFSDSDFYINNTLNTITSGVTIDTGTGLALVLGRRATSPPFFNGYISEYIHWPSDQESNQAGIASNVNTHYTIY